MVTSSRVMKNIDEAIKTAQTSNNSQKKSRTKKPAHRPRLNSEGGHGQRENAPSRGPSHPQSHPRANKHSYDQRHQSASPTSKKSLNFSATPSRAKLTPSPKTCYAGSKCYEPPTPESLPKPPTEWVRKEVANPLQELVTSMQQREESLNASRDTTTNEWANQHLKMLLKVSA